MLVREWFVESLGMKRWDIFDMKSLFPEVRSIALVGNAPTALQGDFGAQIDACDLVVRFNRAEVVGHESQVGRRTDILVANHLNHLGRSPSPGDILQPKFVLCFVHPGELSREDMSRFRAWVGDTPYAISFAPDIFKLPAQNRTRALTMGNYALFTFLQAFSVERLVLSGFTLFGAVPGGATAYFSGGQQYDTGTWHDLDIEAKIFAKLVSGFSGRLAANTDVSQILEQYGQYQVSSTTRISQKAVGKAIGVAGWAVLRLGIHLRRLGERMWF